jgi:F0F1-type ATP synthase assembly protein I
MAGTPHNRNSGFMNQLALAMELPFVFIGTVVIGGAIGYFLDLKLHTAPWLLLAGGALGFAGGMRELLRRLNVSGSDGNSGGGSNNSPDGTSTSGSSQSGPSKTIASKTVAPKK